MAGTLSKYDISSRELAKGRNLAIASVAAPVLLTAAPAITFTILTFIFGVTPPAAFTFFFFGLMATIAGLAIGLGLTGFFLYRRSKWSAEMRERIAADGIKAGEIEWFKREIRTTERRALKQIERGDELMADAYREALATRLTASRIIRSSRTEKQMTERRLRRIKQLKTENAAKFQNQIEADIKKFDAIGEEAKLMLAEAETRLQMIEAAAVRGSGLADSELALKKLSARSQELPLALEEAKLREEIVKELENEAAE